MLGQKRKSSIGKEISHKIGNSWLVTDLLGEYKLYSIVMGIHPSGTDAIINLQRSLWQQPERWL